MSLYNVQILEGSLRGKSISGTFKSPANCLKLGSDKVTKYVPIIDGKSKRNQWVKIASEDSIKFLGVASAVVHETEEQIIDRIRQRFNALDNLVSGVLAGAVRALVVSGPAGVGKSFGIEKALAFSAVNYDYKYETIKGVANALFIYKKLYEYRDNKKILVFDDCDNVFLDSNTLNIFKAALDSSKRRTITWGTESRVLKDNDIPNSFDFDGAVIFVSNLKFDKIRSETLREHLAAVESRCHYLDLSINDARDKYYRIKQVVRDTDILKEYGFGQEKMDEILTFIEQNLGNLRELSLRTVKKLADLALFSPDWKRLATLTCVRN